MRLRATSAPMACAVSVEDGTVVAAARQSLQGTRSAATTSAGHVCRHTETCISMRRKARLDHEPTSTFCCCNPTTHSHTEPGCPPTIDTNPHAPASAFPQMLQNVAGRAEGGGGSGLGGCRCGRPRQLGLRQHRRQLAVAVAHELRRQVCRLQQISASCRLTA